MANLNKQFWPCELVKGQIVDVAEETIGLGWVFIIIVFIIFVLFCFLCIQKRSEYCLIKFPKKLPIFFKGIYALLYRS